MKKRRLKKMLAGGMQAGQIGSQLVDSIDQEDQYGARTNAGAIGSGVLKGAGTGFTLGSMIPIPGAGLVGAGVGAAVGGVKGLIDNKKAKEDKEQTLIQQRFEDKRLQRNNYNNLLNSGYKVGGNQGQEFYKMGGKLSKLSNNTVEVEGATHEEGGVKLPNQGIEVEGGETINKNFVFSEELGFAQKHKPIAKSIGKIEMKPQNKLTKNSLSRLRQKEDLLKVGQETLKMKLGIPNDLESYAFGGGVENHGSKKVVLDANGNPTQVVDIHTGRQMGEAWGNNEKALKYHQSADPIINLSPEQKLLNYRQKINFNPVTTRPNTPEGIRQQAEFNLKQKFYNTPQSDGSFRSLSDDEFSNYEFNGTNYNSRKMGGSLKKMRRGGTEGLNMDFLNQVKGSATNPIEEESSSNKFDFSKLNSVVPYASNLINSFQKIPSVPNPVMENSLRSQNVNFGSQRAEADKQRLSFNKGIDQSTSNSAIANVNKAAIFGQSLAEKNRINQDEQNINSQLGMQTNQLNSQIGARNTERLNEFKNNQVNRTLAQQGRVSDNISNLGDKYQLQQKDNKLFDLEGRKLDVVKEQYKNSGVWDRNLSDEENKALLGLKKKYGGKLKRMSYAS